MKPDFLDELAQEHLSAHAAGHQQQSKNRAIKLLLLGLAIAFALLWSIGLRQDLSAAAVTQIFWLKLVFPLSLAWFSSVALWRLAHPGHHFWSWLHALLVSVIVFWCISLLVLPPLTTDVLETQFWGKTWLECVGYISLLSLPLTAALVWVLRGYGVLMPRMGGFLCGLTAGSVAAALYALHCREPGLLFLGSWYVLGAVMPAIFGVFIGPRFLAWNQ
jgi:hypothetical protein